MISIQKHFLGHVNVRKAWGMVFLLAFFWQAAWSQDHSEAKKVYFEFSGNVAFQYRAFLKDELYTGQKSQFPSLSAEPEFFWEWKGGDNSFTFKPFGRLDRDKARTHFDIREAYWHHVKNSWELSIGIKKVYWGVAESNHLVDIINQTDVVESFDGEQKLGQPMLHFTYYHNWADVELFLLPYHRKRKFPGTKGRLRPAFEIDDENPIYESSAKEYRPDAAVRITKSVGMWDFGVSHFYGNGREPLFATNETGEANFKPLYPVMNQTGVDIQATKGATLWKFEGIRRWTEIQNFTALVAGFEYTVSNAFNKGWDIGLLGEYLYDSRDDLAFSSMDNDVFIGSRWAFNDMQSSQILAGYIFDLSKSTHFISVEAERRLGNSWKASLEGRIFGKVDSREFAYFIRNDSFLSLNIARYF